MSISAKILLKLTLIIIVLFALACSNPSPPSQAVPPLTNTFTESPGGFTFNYPDGWRYFIPAQNLLVLTQERPDSGDAHADDVRGPAPAMSVQRSLLLTAESSMRESMDEYLRRGPLQTGNWEIVKPVTDVALEADRLALRVSLEGTDNPDAPRMHTEVYLTEADNGMVYVFVLSALEDEWETIRPTLESILASVVILE